MPYVSSRGVFLLHNILPTDIYFWKFIFQNLHLNITWQHLQHLPYFTTVLLTAPFVILFKYKLIYIVCFILWTATIPSHAFISLLIIQIFCFQILRLSFLHLILSVVCKKIQFSACKAIKISFFRLYYTQPYDGWFQGETCITNFRMCSNDNLYGLLF